MTTAQKAPTSADVYDLAFLPGVLGPPLINRAILATLAEVRNDDNLAHAVAFSTKAVAALDPLASRAYELFSAKVAQSGIPVPPRPTAAPGFESWLLSVREAVRKSLSEAPDALRNAAFTVGAAAGDLHNALFVGRNLIYLRSATPEHPLLVQAASNVAKTMRGAQMKLNAALKQTAMPKAVFELVKKLEALFAQPPELAKATTVEAFRSYGDWAQKVAALLESIGKALAATEKKAE